MAAIKQGLPPLEPGQDVSLPTQEDTEIDGQELSYLMNRKRQLKEMDAKIRELAVHRNTLVPVARLPYDVLVYIFILASNISDSVAKLLFTISHVCCSWREAALGCASLWTDIDCGREWAQVMLERAGSAPLRFQFYEEEHQR